MYTEGYRHYCYALTHGHVEDVGDSAGKGEHDDGECDEEEEDVLHHVVDAQDDGAEVLGRNSDLTHREVEREREREG